MRHFAAMLIFAGFVLAQEQTGTIEGQVNDSSGAAMAGVTITVTGSTLLGGARTATTSQTGAYRLPYLPVGIYEVKFEHSGFATRINQDVRVQADATFTLNASLSPSTVTTSVDVVSASPMIETAASDITFSFNKDILDKIPNARDPWAIMNQAPGIVSDTVNVGGTQTGNQPTFRGHGTDPTQATYMFNGANVTDNTDNGGSQFYFDVDSFGEMQVEVNSHGADVQTPGIVLNLVPKSGTNAMHGSASFFYSDDNMESGNLDANLRSLGGTPSNLHKYFDGGLEVGGPIIRNKLFIWGAYRYQDIERYVSGTQTATGASPIDQTVLWFPSAKLDWQVTPKHHFSSFFNMQQKERFNRGLSALVPVISTWNQRGNPIARLFTFRDDWTVTNALVLSFKVSIMDQGFDLDPQPGINIATTPTRYDLGTGAYAAAPPYVYGIAKTLRAGEVSGSYYASNFLHGSHELKFGFAVNDYHVAGNQGGGAFQIYPGSATLEFLNGVPKQVVLYASGAQSVTNPTRSLYVQDGWKLGRRWRFDLGVRWDWQANSLDAATAPASLYFPSVTQAATGNLITWNTLAPRIGVIYDVTGKAKTLLKASYNRYYYQLWTNLGAQASTAGNKSYTYQWNAPTGDCVGGLTSTSCTFDPSQEGQLLSVNDPSAHPVTINKNLKPTHTDEVIAGFSQELKPNLAIQATYIVREDQNLTWLINPNISPADYAPVNGVDPVTGNTLVFYALNPALTSLSPNYLTNRPGFAQKYQGVELEAIRRFSKGFQFVGSYTRGVQKESYGAGSYIDPQDINFENGTRVPFSRPNVVKLISSYALPHHFNVSESYSFSSGANYTRTVNSSAAGVTLPQGNVLALSGERDVNSYPGLNVLDLRVGYDQNIGERHISYYLDVFNILNINTIDSMQTISGPTYGHVLDFIPPRILRLGVKFVF